MEMNNRPRRKCDECEGHGEVLQGKVSKYSAPVTYPVTLDPVVSWPSSTPEWRGLFVEGLRRVTCVRCQGAGEVDDDEIQSTPKGED